MYLRKLRPELSQGDIFTDVPISYLHLGSDGQPARNADGVPLEPDIRLCRAMVLSRDCGIENARWVMVAEIRPMSEIDRNHQNTIRQYMSLNVFYLPKLTGAFEESFVDLRRMDRGHKELFQSEHSSIRKVASIDDKWRRALQFQLALYFGYEETEVWHPRFETATQDIPAQ